jgi:hypothetical protein
MGYIIVDFFNRVKKTQIKNNQKKKFENKQNESARTQALFIHVIHYMEKQKRSFDSYTEHTLHTNYVPNNLYCKHYGSQSRGRWPRAVGTVPKVVGTSCADGGRRHMAVGLGRHRHSQKNHRYRRLGRWLRRRLACQHR